MMQDRVGPVQWRKRSTSGDRSCVEVARIGDRIAVRDTKAHGEGPVLEFTIAEGVAFSEGVVKGEFDPARLAP
jgi:hypothetical protein